MENSSESVMLTWKDVIAEQKSQDYFKNIISFVKQERAQGKIIYPPSHEVFNAFRFTEFSDIKVVIIGQDPYHEPGQAHGLCFSVQDNVRFPPSLVNIFKELSAEYPGYRIPATGSLINWAKQGVFLLNNVLTVEQGRANSHKDIGWHHFTDEVIRVINERLEGVVFMLWGSFAQKKCAFVDPERHCILRSVHPSPLSAHRGFFGCNHFRLANDYLVAHGKTPIDWQL